MKRQTSSAKAWALILLGACSSRPRDEKPSLTWTEFVMPYLESGSFPTPVVSRSAGETLELKANTPGWKALRTLYRPHVGPEVTRWVAQPVAEHFAMTTQHPVGPFYNTHLIWGLNSKGEAVTGFRPVDTTTGCATGCTPVVFHLQIEALGTVMQIIQEPKQPLRKRWHEVLTPDDISKLLQMSQKLPEALRWIQAPKELADESSQFPPATWTTLAPYLVEHGAYTSFRVYEAASKTLESMQQKTPPQLGQEFGRLMSLSDLKAAQKYWEEHTQKLSDAAYERDVAIFHFQTLPFLTSWLLQSGQKLRVEKLFAQPVYQQSLITTYCHFLRTLLESTKGAESLLGMSSSRLPDCGVEQMTTLRLLAASRSGVRSLVESAAKTYNFDQIPPFVLASPKYLRLLYDAAKTLGQTETADRIRAEIKVRHPQVQLTQASTAVQIQNESAAEARYREEMRRGFVADTRPMPKLPLAWNHKTVNLKQKEVLIFFASWCPHCLRSAKDWKEAAIPDDLKRRVLWVEVFGDTSSRDRLNSFCQNAGWSNRDCSEIVQLQGPEQASDFYQSLGLYTVPRVVLINRRSEIVAATWQMPRLDSGRLVRDLRWVLEEASQHKNLLQ